MKTMLLCLAAGAFLAGCDYTVPLVKTPELSIDPGIIGLWQSPKENGQPESLLVLPLSKQEYLVSYPAGSTDAMFARACLCRTADMTLVQLEWFGTAKGNLPDDEDKRVFQFADYALAGDTLTVRMLNADVVKKEVKSKNELAQAIASNKDRPELFKDKMVFIKVKK